MLSNEMERELTKSSVYLRSQGFLVERKDGYVTSLVGGRTLCFDFGQLTPKAKSLIERNGGEVFSVSSLAQVASIADTKLNRRQ